MKDVDHALSIEPRNPDTYCMRAELYVADKRFEEAEKDVNHALQINAQHPGAHATLAELCFYRDDEEAFFDSFVQAANLGYSLCDFSQDIFSKYATDTKFQNLMATLI